MKKFISLIACLIFALSQLSTVAQTEYQIPESVPANNGELDWFIYKDHGGEAKIEKKDILLKSNSKAIYAGGFASIPVTLTYAKLPINFNGDFYLSATMKPAKVDDKHLFGLAFNVAGESDYNAILFDNQFCYYVRVVNGAILGLKDRVIYKYQKGKKDQWSIAIERKNYGDYVLTLNGLEVRTFPASTQFNFPAIGACVTNKGEVKVLEISYTQWAPPTDEE